MIVGCRSPSQIITLLILDPLAVYSSSSVGIVLKHYGEIKTKIKPWVTTIPFHYYKTVEVSWQLFVLKIAGLKFYYSRKNFLWRMESFWAIDLKSGFFHSINEKMTTRRMEKEV